MRDGHFQVSQGSVETLFSWGGKRLSDFAANLFRKICIKFYESFELFYINFNTYLPSGTKRRRFNARDVYKTCSWELCYSFSRGSASLHEVHVKNSRYCYTVQNFKCLQLSSCWSIYVKVPQWLGNMSHMSFPKVDRELEHGRSQGRGVLGPPNPPVIIFYHGRGGVPVSYTHLTLPTIYSV